MKQINPMMGLDIGSTKIVATVGHFAEGGVEILGSVKVPNSGLRKGQVVDIEETVSAISALLENIERITGVPITNTIVGIGGIHTKTIRSKGVIAVSRPDGEISQADVDRVLEAARAVAIPANREIIHVLPKSFTVDAEEGIIDPIGMTGIRLEVEAHIVSSSSIAIKNLVRSINQAGLSIDDLVFAPLATAWAILTKYQKESGVVLVDIGAATTSLVIYEEGDLIHSAILPIGSMHITNDIAIGLKTSIDVAEAVKLKYGTVTKEGVRETDTIDLGSIDKGEIHMPKLKYLCEIIEARLMELFMMIKEELGKVGKDGTLPAGAVFTGGGSQINGLLEMAKSILNLPAKSGGLAQQLAGRVDNLDDPAYANSVGLVLWGLEQKSANQESTKLKLNFGKMEGMVEKARDIFKQFLP